MAKEVFLTAHGLKELELRLQYLKAVKRGEVAEKIRIAREFGDISENAEYDSAKDEQAMIEGEILEIEEKLKTATVIKDEAAVNSSVVTIGSTVEIFDMEFDENMSYKIVGTTEADPLKNKISNESPLGVALIGKKKGQIVEVNAPSGKIKIRILGIKN